MIEIKRKEDCCGCSACVAVCPKECISWSIDKEGFNYPLVDKSSCIECGKCVKVCPVINQNEPRSPLQTFGAKNLNDEVRLQSSSGGVFTILATHIIDEGGVVFGARFDSNWGVVHDFTETIEGLAPLRTSKYVQSDMLDNYSKAKSFLDSGRKVLFSGTPCQIAGLTHFLGKDYPNLLAVDFICHGVPSPQAWNRYKAELLKKHSKTLGADAHFTAISFRHKEPSWERYSFRAEMQSAQGSCTYQQLQHKNIYMRGFLRDIYLRPSCFECPAKLLKSGSHITIADFWGISNVLPDYHDDKGVCLVMINDKRVIPYLEGLDTREADYEKAKQPSLIDSVKRPWARNIFFVKKRGSFDGWTKFVSFIAKAIK